MIGRPPSLPARRTRLLGRDPVIRSLLEQLGLDGAPLVTITGPGGSGKTTLALETARRAEASFAEGAAFVELGDADDPEAVAHTVAVSLGLADAGRTSLDDVLGFLRPRELLLVLDNCEQVLPAAAALVDRVLDRCPGVRVLATSRTSLRVRGEVVVSIPLLALPTGDDLGAPVKALAEIPSVALFVERAKAVDPAFRLDERTAPAVASICTRLDGLPLAIELAAAQAGAITVADIAARIEQDAGFLALAAQAGASRQRTLEATFDWSYRLLDPDEQTLLLRLAAFDGGWTLEAAEEICAGGLTRTVAALLAVVGGGGGSAAQAEATTGTTPPSLTAGQALQAALGAARQAGAPTGAGSEPYPRDAGQGIVAHAARVAGVTPETGDAAPAAPPESSAPSTTGPADPAAGGATRTAAGEAAGDAARPETPAPGAGAPILRPLSAPVAAILARLVDHSMVVREMAGGTARYRLLRPIGEIATARLAVSGELRTVLGVHAAYFLARAAARRPDSTYAGPDDIARIEADEANCLRALASLKAAGLVPAVLAMSAALIEYWRVRGHLRTGRELLESVILAADPATLPPTVLPVRGFALLAACDFSVLLDDLEAAEGYVTEAEAIFTGLRFPVGIATSYAMRGNVAGGRGDFEGCRDWYLRARDAVGEDVLDLTRMFWLASLGAHELSFGRLDDAWEHLLAARALTEQLPETWYHGRIAGHLGTAARSRGDIERARPLLTEGVRRLAAYGARVELIPALEALAGLAVDGGDAPRAATLFGAASVLREFTGIGDVPAIGTTGRRDLRRVRGALRLPVLASAWARGRAMTLDEVLAFASAEGEPSGLRGAPGSELTGRERDVALLVARGLTNAEIAGELGISAGTARIHVERILRKLGLVSRVQVATWVVDGGLDPAA